MVSGSWEDKIKKLFLLLTIFLFAFRLWQTTGCKKYAGFYFNPISVRINVEEQRNLDLGTSSSMSKLFHNKVSAFFWEASKSYLNTTSPRFLLDILGPLGLFLAISSFSNVVKKPKAIHTLSLILIGIASLLLILPIDPRKTFYVAAISWYSFSLFSTDTLVKSRKSILLFLFLLLVSFWYFAFSWQMKAICNEIFFN